MEYPDIKLPDYKGIVSRIKKRDVFVQEQEIDNGLLWLRKSRARFSQVARPCQKGDFIEIEFENSIDNQKYKDAFVLGEGRFVPGFEDNIIGMRSGESKEFSLHLPADYSLQNLAGREIHFKIQLFSVQQMELPELNDNFTKGLGNFENLQTLRENIQQGLLAEKETAESQRVRTEILAQVAAEINFNIPQALVRAEQESLMEALSKEVAEKLQISFEEYLAKSHQSREDVNKSFEREAEQRVKNYLVLQEMSTRERIEVTELETQEEANKFFPKHSDPKGTKKDLDPEKLRAYIKDAIRIEKTLAKLESFAKNC